MRGLTPLKKGRYSLEGQWLPIFVKTIWVMLSMWRENDGI
jgi:hypothetical protein